ncbi:MAG: glycosyltransferase family 2 protein [Oscillospiraceae bacterium]|jgi:glycosyltransferase involved in cell wall biosynthesis|nr:glycosyltransferase family 2 protein [Oscillospiraceae bacterium]
MTPLLSVIVTVYNKAPFVKRCVNSALAQSYHNLELIIVDDGSTDNSGALCDALAARDSRARVIRQGHMGVTLARLAGTNAARGEYIHYVDGDDWLEPDMESALMAALIETGADMAVTGYIDTRGIHHPAGSVPAGTYDRAALERDVFPYMMESRGEGTMGLYSSLWTCAARKGLIAPILRGVDPRIRSGEDGLCLYGAVAGSRRLAVVGGSYYRYCPNPTSVTARPLPGHFGNLELLMDGYLRSPMAGIPSIRRQFPNKFWYHVLRGDTLARRSGKPYSAVEREQRGRVAARIQALERDTAILETSIGGVT